MPLMPDKQKSLTKLFQTLKTEIMKTDTLTELKKIEMGNFYTSGGSAAQYIKTHLGEQSLCVNTWNTDKEITQGNELAKAIVHRFNNYDALLSALKEINEFHPDALPTKVIEIVKEAIKKAEGNE